MDVRAYFQKVRKIESELPEEFLIVSSLDTEDGGKKGILTEVARRGAARMIVEGKARQATPEEQKAYFAQVAEDRRAADDLAAAGKLQVAFVSGEDLKAIKTSTRTQK